MRKKLLRALTFFFAPPVAYLIVRLLLLSAKKKFHLPLLPDEPYIVAMWHGELLLVPYMYQKVRNQKVSVIASEHSDGILISTFVSYFGVDSIKGSSSKGGAKALLEAIKRMRKGEDIAITPDGPRGPYHSVAEGIIAIAQKNDCYIVPHRIVVDRVWQLQSWDKFIVPKPFASIDFIAGEPFKVTQLNKEEALARVKENMEQAV